MAQSVAQSVAHSHVTLFLYAFCYIIGIHREILREIPLTMSLHSDWLKTLHTSTQTPKIYINSGALSEKISLVLAAIEKESRQNGSKRQTQESSMSCL